MRHMYKQEQISIDQTWSQQNTQRNMLHLRGSEYTYFKQQIMVDFQAVKAIDPSISPTSLSTFSIIPIFNTDSKYYTAAFVNPFDYEEKEERKMLNQYQNMRKQYTKQIPQPSILLAKPRGNSYCAVCKLTYDDYLQHLQTNKHTKLVKKSRYSRLIEDLRQTYFTTSTKSESIIVKQRK